MDNGIRVASVSVSSTISLKITSDDVLSPGIGRKMNDSIQGNMAECLRASIHRMQTILDAIELQQNDGKLVDLLFLNDGSVVSGSADECNRKVIFNSPHIVRGDGCSEIVYVDHEYQAKYAVPVNLVA